MTTLDPNIVFRANPQQQPANYLGSLAQAAPIAAQIQQQQQQEQIADIFSRNIETTPEGVRQLNKGSALAELYQIAPQKALQFESAYAQIKPEDDLGLKQRKADLEERKFGLSEKKFGLDERKLQAEIDRIAEGGLDPEKAASIEEGLRKEYVKQNIDFQKVGNAYNRIQASRGQDTGASDLSLIFNYMKMLDPGSTVREGEFATAENSGGVVEKTRNLYNKALSGTRLTKKVRGDFFGQTEKLMDAAERGNAKSRRTFRGLSTRNNVNPANVVIDISRNVEYNPGEETPIITEFVTVEEATAANLPKGTVITIGGRKAVIE